MIYVINMIRIKEYILEQNHLNHKNNKNHSSDKGLTYCKQE